MSIKNIGVLGAGIMGAGIAQVAAAAGYKVIMRDINENLVQKGLAALEANLKRAVDKGKMSAEESAAIQARVTGTVELAEAVSKADLVIEAIVENMEIKKEGVPGTGCGQPGARHTGQQHLGAFHHRNSLGHRTPG